MLHDRADETDPAGLDTRATIRYQLDSLIRVKVDKTISLINQHHHVKFHYKYTQEILQQLKF